METEKLDRQFGDQKTLSLNKLRKLVEPIQASKIKAEVDRLLE